MATIVAFKAAYVWPIAALLFTLAGVTLALGGRASQSQLDIGFVVIALIELVLLGFYVISIILPSVTLFYGFEG